MKTFAESKWNYIGLRDNGWHAFKSKPVNGFEPEVVLVKRARYLHVDGTSTYYGCNGSYDYTGESNITFPIRKVSYDELSPALRQAMMTNRGRK